MTTRTFAGSKGIFWHNSANPEPSHVFQVAALVTAGWFVSGVFLDGWAHIHLPHLETFFTPWHGVLYTGFGAVALALILGAWRNHAPGDAWRNALPAGYGLSLLGVPVFFLGGVSDMVWHSVFGIEANVDALLSPTHLVLASAMLLIVSGPLRSAWLQPGNSLASLGRATTLAALLSGAFSLALLEFFTSYAQPFVDSYAGNDFRDGFMVEIANFGWTYTNNPELVQSLGIAAIVVHTFLLMGLALLLLRRWTLPRGTFTLIFTVTTALISILHDQYALIIVAFIAGVSADVLYRAFNPSPTRPIALRLFAFSVPGVLYSLYFGTLLLTQGIWWSIHLWTGTIVVAGLAGLLVSYILVPPGGADLRRRAEKRSQTVA